jgi:hypothetical protein
MSKAPRKSVIDAGKGKARKQRIYGPDGRSTTVFTVDMNSATFGSDLHYAFERNVARARRENKRRFGSADGIARKS